MMKKLGYLVVLFGIMLFPSMVSAYELSCGNGPYSFNDSFICTIKGANNINYDVMKGTIEGNSNVSCITTSFADGMRSTDTEEVSNKFSISGRSANDELVSFKCQVIGKAQEDTTMQLFINDFTYHNSTSQAKEQTEILRSNTFSLKKYDEQATKPVDNKPRDTSNSNSRLRGISAEGLDFTFSSFITEYNIDVVYEVDEIDLLVLPYNLEATYRIVGSQKLSIGENTIDVYVTSPDGKSITCYTLYIKRLPRGEEVYYPENDASLKDLIISGQNIAFEKDKLEYSINISYDVDSVDINAVATVEDAKIEIINSKGLKNGDVISIIVESSNGTQSRKYLITVNKAAAPYDYSKIMILGGVVVLGIILIFLFIRSSRKQKEDPLLKLKNDKRTMNKGNNFDPNAVPEATSAVQNVEVAPNVIKADNVSVVTPMMVDPNAVDTNRNKISTNVNTLDLNSTTLPTQLPASPADLNAVNNQLPETASTNQNQLADTSSPQVNTLDLSSTAALINPINNDVNIFDIPPVPNNNVGAINNQTEQQAVIPPTPVTSLDQVQSVAIPVPTDTNQNQ